MSTDPQGMDDDHERPPWDEDEARELLGKVVLVGLTYVGPAEEVIGQVQLHGEIERVSPHYGFAIARTGTGEVFWLPPDLRAFDHATPGEYRLRSTGDVLVDPDLISTWTVQAGEDGVDPDWRETLRAGYEPPED